MPYRRPIVVAVSGAFNPLHAGHVDMLNKARGMGDQLVVIMNNDKWIKRRGGVPYMSQLDRRNLLRALRPVDRVMLSRHTENSRDMSVSRELLDLKPHIFVNGGPHTPATAPEHKICEENGIKTVYNVGKNFTAGGK